MSGYRADVHAAFAWAFVWDYPRVTITVNDESPFSHFTRLYGPQLNVTVSHPWAGPDPRGPGLEAKRYVADPDTGRLVLAGRPPLLLQTVVPFNLDVHQLAWVAVLARERFEREYQRGYAVISPAPPPPETVSRAPRLLPA